MRYFLAVIIVLFLFENSFSQNDSIKKQKIDSLTKKLIVDSAHTYRFKKLRPYANIDSRNSFLTTNLTNLSGFQLGVIVNEYHTFGFGLYTLTKFSKTNTPLSAVSEFNRFGYINAFYEYFLLNRRYLEIDLPFEIGVGGFQAKLRDTSATGLSKIEKWFVPLGAGVKFIAKPVRWIGISSMIGYRYIPYKQSLLDYDGLYYSLGVWVDFRQIYRDIKYLGLQKKKYRRDVQQVLLN
ncbi:MAG: hypothetical protein H0W73_02710 [Bacteroidetes bacterium]|nr:hypothetical protein [Bacteroidota bacterium]